jgi:hypothetical protein
MPKQTEEQKAKSKATKEAKKAELAKPSWVVFEDGSKKKACGFYKHGHKQEAAKVCYEDGKFRYWVEVKKIDTENKLYFV